MDFLCVLGRSEDHAARRFAEARAVVRALAKKEQGAAAALGSHRALAIARVNGTGAPVVCDLKTGSWVLAAGTWLHRDGFAAGDEQRLLERFLAVGADRLAGELDGFFTVVVHDAVKHETSVITDLIGTCHAFVREDEGSVALAGSSLLLAALGDGALDSVAVQELLFTGIVYEGRTIHAGVRKLPAASVITWDRALSRRERLYWTIANVDPNALDGQAAVDAVWGKLSDGARRIGALFTKPAVDLTGGRDSRAVAAAFLEAGAPFTATVCGPEDNRDVVVSKDIARKMGIEHLHIPERATPTLAEIRAAIDATDGECDAVEYARIRRIHLGLATNHDATMNGTFGELARGHWWGQLLHRAGRREPLDVEQIARMRFITQESDASMIPAETRLELGPHFVAAVQRTNAGLTEIPNTAQMQNLYLMLRLQHWYGRIASSTDRIWPCLAPWCLRSVLETVLSVTPSARKSGSLVKRILTQANPRLARIPLDDGLPAMPLTWQTFPHFRTAPIVYGKKALARMRTRFPHAPKSAAVPSRIHLLLDPETQAILDPRSMRACALLDRGTTESFLAGALSQSYRFDLQWNRLLSLELTLRRLGELRASRRKLVEIPLNDAG